MEGELNRCTNCLLFYHYENFDDVLGISLRCQFQRVSDYLLSKDDTMASFYINSQDDDIYEENWM